MTDNKLSTAFVSHPDINLAAQELLENALRVVAAGRFVDGRNLMLTLLTPGPWALAKHGALTRKLAQWLPMVSDWCDTDCPSLGPAPAMTWQEVADLARQEIEQQSMYLTMLDRNYAHGVGQDWTQPLSDYFESGLRSTKDGYHVAFHTFCVHAQGILKMRLDDAFAAMRTHRPAPQLDADMVSFLGGLDNIASLLSSIAPGKASPNAQAISTQEIGHALLAYQRKHRVAGNYVTTFVLQAAMVLSALDGHDADAAHFANALAQTEPHDFAWLPMLRYAPVRALFASGVCAAELGVTDASLATLQQAIASRLQAPAQKGAPKTAFFQDTLESFTAAIAGSSLQGRNIVELPVLGTPERAYAIFTTVRDMEKDWRQARQLVAATGRWPIVTYASGGTGGNFREQLVQADLFSRFYFEEAPNADDISPRAIIAAADNVDVQAFLQKKEQQHGEDWDYAQYIDPALQVTRHYCGQVPTQQELADARVDGEPLTTKYRLNRWLLEWELRHNLSIDLADVRQEWYDNDQGAALLFLPTPNAWDALAYVNWYGTSDFGTEYYIALGRSWQERYGAELFFHSGTELRCFSDKPPGNVDDAWVLAREHSLASPDTLIQPGIAVRHHALGLVNCDRWLLFNSP